MTPRGMESCMSMRTSAVAWNKLTNYNFFCKVRALTGVTTSDLNQNILPCFNTKYLQGTHTIEQYVLECQVAAMHIHNNDNSIRDQEYQCC